MKKESEIRKRLEKEIYSFLTCPKFAVEEHANYIYALAWVLDMTDSEVDELLQKTERS